jgi:DNA-binding transcriptional MocR family regulator
MKPGSACRRSGRFAKQLGVTLTTVTRAYDEAQRRGLAHGRSGARDTSCGRPALDMEGTEQGVLDLALNALMPLPIRKSSRTG